jgi:hypothetical protein
VSAADASAQIAPRSGCADCHYSDPRSPMREHLDAWARSPHGRANVGCEQCHGGNPKTFEPRAAHAAILPPTHASSPVNRRNLPSTCGVCHTGPFVAFQKSRHFGLLQSGNDKGPSCSTCHGDVGGRVLSPKALEGACNDCHGEREAAPRAERARRVRELYEGVAVVREQMKLAGALIRRVDDKNRRATLLEMHQQAQIPLMRALDAGHRFVYDELKEQLAVAEQRVTALLSTMANRSR